MSRFGFHAIALLLFSVDSVDKDPVNAVLPRASQRGWVNA